MSIMEHVKAHPYLIGGVVVGGVLLVMLLGSSSGTTSTDASTADASQSANNYNNAMAQIQGSLGMASISAGAQAQHDAASVTVAQLNAGVADNANTLAAQVAMFTSDLASKVAINHDTTTLQAIEAQLNTQAGMNQSNNNTSVANTQTLAGVIINQSNNQTYQAVTASNNQASTFASYISALPGITASHDNAAVAVAQAARPCSSYLFGLISDC
jgi:hypothetical protein